MLVITIMAKLNNTSVGELFDATAKRFPDKTMIVYIGENNKAEKMTFREANEQSNRVANYFQSQHYAKGDVLAVCLENRIDYPCIWMGLGRIGCVSALVNTYIKGESLVHTMAVVKAKAVLFSTDTEQGLH
jgi:solute carrier family 27 fatty acid transporter 1/4